MKKLQFEQLISVGCGIDVDKDVILATSGRPVSFAKFNRATLI